MRKIAIYYPYFTGGGAEAVVLWMLQALRERYDLTLFTISHIDFKRLNSMYGTNLSSQNIKVKTLVPKILSYLCNFMIANSAKMRLFFLHLLIRFFKQNNQNYDLVISAYNAIDLGKVGIQYIHWVKVIEATPFYKEISNFSETQLAENVSLANSYYVANIAKETYGVNAKVVFPPVVMNTPNVLWSDKEDAFICSGRIVKMKEPHRVINILKLVREQGFDIKLYLTGGGGGIYGWEYNHFIKKIIKENSSWITLYENLPYKEYMKILAKCKYGIHYKKEPFGISIAEMVKAGAIPFVRNVGGQIEIVGQHNGDLFFSNEVEAVERIVELLKNPIKQSQLIHSLEEQRNLFSTHKFMLEINEVVSSYFEKIIDTSNSLVTSQKGK
ncbi:glycosyl transferase family 1 [Scytonema hofmannii PCC 7110]|uniref:Glycosyl transferase family 1 n=1 Tax=Scytonema hofmannii PCC 7110 TaxID=128403 RepID=A0A139XBA4_9CYAN|nr:glycosyltransferase [Scytonema hofmannii]KYC41988.1 glycosyl transferase family 1 [Scytonema hofmannii PCC 7110]